MVMVKFFVREKKEGETEFEMVVLDVEFLSSSLFV